ncbi:glycosyltransferase family 2 protein [Thermodesulfobacteriota bacterium]
MPKVGVVIPCYNLGQYLMEALNSVLRQTLRDVEVVIVDDGSTDKLSEEVLDSIDDSRVTLIRTENRGPSAARNTGVKNTTAEYIVCLDADDCLDPTYLEKTARILDEDRGSILGFVSTFIKMFGERDEIIPIHQYSKHRLAFANQTHVASMFRKRCWEEVGGYYEDEILYFEDWFFWLSMVVRGYKWVTIEEPLFCYRVRGGSRFTVLDANRHLLYSKMVARYPRFFLEGLIAWWPAALLGITRKYFKVAGKLITADDYRVWNALSDMRNFEILAPFERFRAVFQAFLKVMCSN